MINKSTEGKRILLRKSKTLVYGYQNESVRSGIIDEVVEEYFSIYWDDNNEKLSWYSRDEWDCVELLKMKYLSKHSPYERLLAGTGPEKKSGTE